MVSKWWMGGEAGVFAENRSQSKFYTESTHSNFSRIFGDLTSMQTLAIYPRLVVKE